MSEITEPAADASVEGAAPAAPASPEGGGEPTAPVTPPEGAAPEGGGEGAEIKPPADEEPPVRMTKQQHIDKRIATKAAKVAPDGPVNPAPNQADVDVINQVIQATYGDDFAAIKDQRLDGEISALVQTNPAFKGHEAQIKKFAAHPAYSQLPIEQAAYAAVGGKLMKAGADLARIADKESAESGTGGGSARTVDGGKKDWSQATDSEVDAQMAALGV